MANMTIEDIVRAVIAIGFLIIFGYLTISGRDLTNQANNVLLIIIGFYFGLNEIARFAGKFADRKKEEGIYNVTDNRRNLDP